MKPTSLKLILFLFLVVLLFSCTKTDSPDDLNPPDSGGIYATYNWGGQHRNRKAVLWKDGAETDLSNHDPAQSFGTNLYTSAVAVSPTGDVYVAGCECYNERADILNLNEDFDSCFTVLWKNGVKQNLNANPIMRWFLEGDDTDLEINDNGDVFVLGRNSDDVDVYSVWKNGNKIIDMDDVFDVSDMFVRGNDVYVTGHKYDTFNFTAALWKNGALQNLSGNSKIAETVYVSANNDVYVGLYNGLNNGKLLKNNVEQTLNVLPGNTINRINDIIGSGTEIYVLGYTGGKGSIWKNGEQIYEIDNINGIYTSIDLQAIFVSGIDVYAYGVLTNSKSCCGGTSAVALWKNGEVYKTLYDDYGIFVQAPSIFVK